MATPPQLYWMEVLRIHGALCDTTVRGHHALILQPPRAYNEATQIADLSVRQITQIKDVVGTKMSVSPLT